MAKDEKDCCYEASTIMALRIIDFMRHYQADAEMIQNEFIGEIGEYETKLAEREGLNVKP